MGIGLDTLVVGNCYMEKKDQDENLKKDYKDKLKKLAIYNKHPQVIQLNTLKNDVKKIAEKYNFKFIDTDNYFLQLKDPLSVFHYGLNTHFNSLGNDILSRAIVDSL
tara:strand:+ start:69 stop:389 length:321 start_codon:yes stop_codon:yes gene_type:complete